MEQLETISVVPHKERHDDARPASPSWFVAKINPVSRFIGALILCIPMFVTLDVVSASVAFVLEMLLLWIGGVAPWTVLRKTWPVWIAASGSFISVALYGKTSGAVLVNLGNVIVISQGSLYLALATFLRVAAIAVPGVILALGLDPTDLADGLVQILHLPSRFVYGGLAGMRMFTLLQNDWYALGQSRRSRGLGDGVPSSACFLRRSAYWLCRFDAARSLPPPWRRVLSERMLHVARPGNHVCMPSTGCFMRFVWRCR